ncbi:MAG: hypothetical protein ACM3P1_12880 [Candidatus Saccharibacteria bacterium]
MTMFILYCFFISMYSTTVVSSSSLFSDPAAQENFYSVVLSNGIHHAEQVQSLFHVGKNIHRTSLKNSFNQFSFSSLAAIEALKNSTGFSLYIFFSENLFIRFSKTDIIFPFHNFW